MTDNVIDLSKPTGYFEVSVEHHDDSLYAENAGHYSVDVDRGLGRWTVYQAANKDKALGVAEYVESVGRIDRDEDGEFIANEGEPFNGAIGHRDCQHD